MGVKLVALTKQLVPLATKYRVNFWDSQCRNRGPKMGSATQQHNNLEPLLKKSGTPLIITRRIGGSAKLTLDDEMLERGLSTFRSVLLMDKNVTIHSTILREGRHASSKIRVFGL